MNFFHPFHDPLIAFTVKSFEVLKTAISSDLPGNSTWLHCSYTTSIADRGAVIKGYDATKASVDSTE